MIIIYNILLVLLFIISLPYMLIKIIINDRFRYKIKDRFIPSEKIRIDRYILFHASSFGEVKALLDVLDIFKDRFKERVVFSVFTDTGFKFIKQEKVFLMPIDIYPLYSFIFKSKPKIALFFETEIWPSYIYFLKKNGIKIVLINARMSDKSFKNYSKFAFFFKRVIGKMDLVIAKSEQDAEKFRKFTYNVKVCGNIKQFKRQINVSNDEVDSLRKKFSINTKKRIAVFGSIHKEEIDFAVDVITSMKDNYYFVVAPRHMEDVKQFEVHFKNSDIDYSKRNDINSSDVLILDTMGELEDIYKISDVVIIGGSMVPGIGGHNPIEAVRYNKYVICGEYMESFSQEVKDLKRFKLIFQSNNTNDIIDKLNDLSLNVCTINSEAFEDYFRQFSNIIDCYMNNLKLLSQNVEC